MPRCSLRRSVHVVFLLLCCGCALAVGEVDELCPGLAGKDNVCPTLTNGRDSAAVLKSSMNPVLKCGMLWKATLPTLTVGHVQPVKPNVPAGKRSPSCAADTCCPLPGEFSGKKVVKGLQPSHRVTTVPLSATANDIAPRADKWWERDADQWVSPHSEEEFHRSLVQAPGEELVVVEWFATWCSACRTVFSKMRKIVSDPNFKNVKFVKCSIDELRSTAKKEGFRVLPHVTLYRDGKNIIGMALEPGKVDRFKTNLQTILNTKDPDKDFVLDPNGFITTVVRKSDEEKASEKAKVEQALQEMKERNEELHKRLMGIGTGPSKPVTSNGAPQKEPVTSAKSDFLAEFSNDYGYGGQIDALYSAEVASRMKPNEHYLDYTGSSLYCNSQLDGAIEELKRHVFGNPHSANPSSELSTEKVEEVRDMILQFFNADPLEYNVVFTPSATGSLKLVGETFPWTRGSQFRYLRENHNSVLGMREYAVLHGGKYRALSELQVEAWLQRDVGLDTLDEGDALSSDFTYNLFAFPAEDNFAGVKYPLDWIQKVQAKSSPNSRWMVMLDAAAYIPTQPLDLRKVRPDYVALSFYKIFGYPTGLGALVVRSDAVEMLRKVFWGGGTVSLATSADDFHVLKCRPCERLEDGTVAFLDIIALKHGFNMLQRLGGIKAVQRHVAALSHYLYLQLVSLKHRNGAPVVRIFGKHNQANWQEVQGGIVNFEVLNPAGAPYSYRTFQLESAAAGIHVRTGAECNPGACYSYVGIEDGEVEQLAGTKEGCNDDIEWIMVKRPVERKTPTTSDWASWLGQATKVDVAPSPSTQWVRKPMGTIRASLGYMSTFEDVDALIQFIKTRYVNRR
eukprot:jgi/Botrbrau1/11483/Bobra.0360s0010.1